MFNLIKKTLDFHKFEYNLCTLIAFYAYYSHHKQIENCTDILNKIRNYDATNSIEVFDFKIINEYLEKSLNDTESELSSKFKKVYKK